MRLPLLAALAVLGTGFAPVPFPKPAKAPQAAAEVMRQLEGTWRVERYSVGGRVQGGPGPKWEAVVVRRGKWFQAGMINGRLLYTTPYVITVHGADATRVDMAYPHMDKPLLSGILRLDGDRLTVTHATSGPQPTSHTAELPSGQVRWELRREKR